MFTIEKNIPLASQKAYPFDQMEVGDSFAEKVPDGVDAGSCAAAMRSRAAVHGVRGGGAKFIVRLIDNKAALRVWRVK
jgi:hypothetical protein